MAAFTLKRMSGKPENGSERLKAGASGRDGVRVETLDCDERVVFGRRSSGSVGGITVAKAIVAALSMVSEMKFIVTLEEDLSAPQLFSVTVCLWRDSWQRSLTFHFEFSMKPTKPSERVYSLMASQFSR